MASHEIAKAIRFSDGDRRRINTSDIAIGATLVETIADRTHCKLVRDDRNVSHALNHGIVAAKAACVRIGGSDVGAEATEFWFGGDQAQGAAERRAAEG